MSATFEPRLVQWPVGYAPSAEDRREVIDHAEHVGPVLLVTDYIPKQGAMCFFGGRCGHVCAETDCHHHNGVTWYYSLLWDCTSMHRHEVRTWLDRHLELL